MSIQDTRFSSIHDRLQVLEADAARERVVRRLYLAGGLALGALAVPALSMAANPVPHKFEAGTAARADEVNANFEHVVKIVTDLETLSQTEDLKLSNTIVSEDAKLSAHVDEVAGELDTRIDAVVSDVSALRIVRTDCEWIGSGWKDRGNPNGYHGLQYLDQVAELECPGEKVLADFNFANGDNFGQTNKYSLAIYCCGLSLQ